MSFFPGPHGSVFFEADELVWTPSNGEKRRVKWSQVDNVVLSDAGVTIHADGPPLLVPKDVVWFEFVAEDIMTEAAAANPSYKGPVPTSSPRDVTVPTGHQQQLDYTRRAQRYYGDRCPTYQEFKAFLEGNLNRRFDEDSFYECSMSMCSGSPVDEGYSTDLRIGEADRWYRSFEKLVGGGRHTGKELLETLRRVEPGP